MDGCTECKEIHNLYDTIGKTYYKLPQYNDEPVRILCYRHWHQKGEPPYERRGEYDQIFSKSIYIKKHGSKQT
jgi:hypothetical protein